MRKGLKKLILLLILFIILISFIYLLIKTVIFPTKYSEIVEKAAKEYNVDPYLIYSVIKKESNFKKHAISHSNAKGLMQIMDSTADDVVRNINTIPNKEYNIYDEYNNIYIGTKYLSELITIYEGNMYLAITAYNAGMGNVNKWIKEDLSYYDNMSKVLEIIKFQETKEYVIDVFRYYNIYKFIY